MASKLEGIARKIKSGVRSAGTLKIWGVNVSRSGDTVYQVAGASVTDDRVLRLHLHIDVENASPIVELDSPSAVTIEDGNLRIAKAVAVRLDGVEKPVQPGAADALFLGN